MPEPELVTLTETDLPELAALCAATLPYDDCSPGLLRTTLPLGTPAEPALPLGLRLAGRLVAVAVGALNASDAGPVGHVKLVATAAETRRRGYARRLLGELEARFRGGGAGRAVVAFPRRYFVPGVDLRYSRALCCFDRLGYVRRALTYNLEVDLTRRSFDPSGLIDGLRQERIDVRRLGRGDEAAFAAYLGASWGTGWQYQGLQALRSGREPLPGHLALAGDAVVGFAVYDVTRPGWFGPIGTAAARRGKSVGTALLHACLFDWQRQGRHRGEIAGIGPLYFYVTACDAAIARAFQQFEKPLS
jgi:mycothiol synthase